MAPIGLTAYEQLSPKQDIHVHKLWFMVNAASTLCQYNLKCNRVVHLCQSWFRPCGNELGACTYDIRTWWGRGSPQEADKRNKNSLFVTLTRAEGIKNNFCLWISYVHDRGNGVQGENMTFACTWGTLK